MVNRYNISLHNVDSIQVSTQQNRANVVLHDPDQLELAGKTINLHEIELNTPIYFSENDYNNLMHKPSINGVILHGDLTSEDLFLPKQSVNTKEYWNLHIDYVPARGEIVIYSNRNTVDGVDYPGIKIGDGNAYLVDLPFVGDDTYLQLLNMITDHINNTAIHVTPADKERWDNKLNYSITDENLIFNRL